MAARESLLPVTPILCILCPSCCPCHDWRTRSAHPSGRETRIEMWKKRGHNSLSSRFLLSDGEQKGRRRRPLIPLFVSDDEGSHADMHMNSERQGNQRPDSSSGLSGRMNMCVPLFFGKKSERRLTKLLAPDQLHSCLSIVVTGGW